MPSLQMTDLHTRRGFIDVTSSHDDLLLIGRPESGRLVTVHVIQRSVLILDARSPQNLQVDTTYSSGALPL